VRLISIAVGALVLAHVAAADIGIVNLRPTRAHVGDAVTVHVNGYLPLDAASMPVVLVRAKQLPRPFPCKGGGICEPIVWRARLGRLPYVLVGFARNWVRNRNQPDHADAIVRFRLPAVPLGRYRVALWCGPCVRGPQGSLIGGPTLAVR
jgi:hypothetical protein